MASLARERIKQIDELEVSGKRVFLRLDLNVPLSASGEVLDNSRLVAVLPTLHALKDRGARLILASHLGRPKGERVSRFSLRGVATQLTKLVQAPVAFVEEACGPRAQEKIQAVKPGEMLLLENTRFYPGETQNSESFSRDLAEGMEVYVDDAFGSLHRAHASTVGMVKFFKHKAAGPLVTKELEALTPLLENPSRPFTVILGGAKVADKIGVIQNLSKHVDRLILGGGMAFTFLQAKGIEVGESIVDAGKLEMVKQILEDAATVDKQILLPVDFRIASNGEAEVVSSLQQDDRGLDIGPESVEHFTAAIQGSQTVFWNGPLGVFEQEPFMAGTLAIAKALATTDAKVIIGGGDTLAAFHKLDLLDKVAHASTGGGATLEFLEGRLLPGLEALMD